MGAVIEIPVLQIAAHAREDGCFVPRLDVAGQHQVLARDALLRRNDGDGRRRLRLGPLRNLGLLGPSQQNSRCRDGNGDDGGKQPHPSHGSARSRRRRRNRLAGGPMVLWHDDSPGHALDGWGCEGPSASPDGRWRWECSRLKTVGTKNSVATVATRSPPMTARPRGAFCSPPSPRANAIGSMPMIMASAVISTGRKRVNPASIAAVAESRPSARPSRAKLTSRMLFAVAMPMHMMAPVRAGTDRVVPVMNSIQTMPASAAGSAVMMMKGSSHDWKLTTITR